MPLRRCIHFTMKKHLITGLLLRGLSASARIDFNEWRDPAPNMTLNSTTGECAGSLYRLLKVTVKKSGTICQFQSKKGGNNSTPSIYVNGMLGNQTVHSCCR